MISLSVSVPVHSKIKWKVCPRTWTNQLVHWWLSIDINQASWSTANLNTYVAKLLYQNRTSWKCSEAYRKLETILFSGFLLFRNTLIGPVYLKNFKFSRKWFTYFLNLSIIIELFWDILGSTVTGGTGVDWKTTVWWTSAKRRL